MHAVLLAIPPQAHGDEHQKDEHHHPQNAAYNQVEQATRGAGGVQGVGVGGWGGGHSGGLDPGTSSMAGEGAPSTQGVISAPVKVVLGGLKGGLGRVGATLGGAVAGGILVESAFLWNQKEP